MLLCADYTIKTGGTKFRLKEKHNCKQGEHVLTIIYSNIGRDRCVFLLCLKLFTAGSFPYTNHGMHSHWMVFPLFTIQVVFEHSVPHPHGVQLRTEQVHQEYLELKSFISQVHHFLEQKSISASLTDVLQRFSQHFSQMAKS